MRNDPHENIIQYYDIFMSKQQDSKSQHYLYFQLPLMPCDLFDIVSKNPTNNLSDEHRMFYFQNIVNGISYLHCRWKIAHRDISLENVLVNFNSDGSPSKVVIIDFELSTFFEDKDGNPCYSAGLVGKPPYISPEQYVCSSAYHANKVDIWALGILLFLLVVHVPPFAESLSMNNNYREYFYHRDSETLIRKYKEWNQNITKKGVDMLLFAMYILNPNPMERPTICDINQKIILIN